jgi:hypothetical protein
MEAHVSKNLLLCDCAKGQRITRRSLIDALNQTGA